MFIDKLKFIIPVQLCPLFLITYLVVILELNVIYITWLIHVNGSSGTNYDVMPSITSVFHLVNCGMKGQ